MDNLKDIENLLKQVQVKVSHSKELSKLNGENFNLFSILNLESNENRTHSRFLAELLNPRGSHEMGSIFLGNFLDVLGIDKSYFDIYSADVTIEKYIGAKDDIEKLGGRIDIAVSDKDGKNIFIENKIYAIDQIAQIERYCNYKKNNSSVYYLTLWGGEPAMRSKGILLSGVDFCCISYQKTIIEWLELCMKEATDQPILRETIKQYIILIKKMTGQLINDTINNDIRNLILNNLESAEVIFQKFQRVKFDIPSNVRIKLQDKLGKYFLDKYSVQSHAEIGDRDSKIWFHNEISDFTGIHFGIEPFSGNGHRRNELFIGIIDYKSLNADLFQTDKSKMTLTGWWRGIRHFDSFEGYKVVMSDIKFLQFLHNNPSKVDELIEYLAKQIIEYLEEYHEPFTRIVNIAKNRKN